MTSNGTSNTDGKMSATDDLDNSGYSAYRFCRDYIRGCCSRENCRFIHEIPAKPFLKELFRFCHDYQNKGCFRTNCKFIHSSIDEEEIFYSSGVLPRDPRHTPVCPAFINGGCNKKDCKFIHPPDVLAGNELVTVTNMPPPPYNRPPPPLADEDSPPEAKFRRFAYEELGNGMHNGAENHLPLANVCPNCESLDHKVKLLHDNISVLLKKVADLTEKNIQLTSMNEFLLEQTASIRTDQPCVITSRHGTSAPVSLATVSMTMTPVVSLAGALPTLVPAAAAPNLALAPAASQAQLLTSAPQILTVSTTQQLVGNSGALIVTSAGAQQLMHVSDSGALMGGGQTVVAVTPAQLTLTPQAQQLMSNASQSAVQQLVQQSALGRAQYAPTPTVQHLAAQQSAQLAAHQSAQHLAAQQSAQHLAAQQSAQHLAAQQSAQHLAAQQSAQHLVAAQQSAQHLAAAQQSAQHLAAAAQQSAQQLAAAAQQSAQQMVAQHQQSAQQLAAQQSAQQQLVPSAQQLVHQTSTQQITISSTSQPMALPNSQAQPIAFPMMSQSIIPH